MRAARRATAAVFALNGFLAAMWVAHIPVITARTGVSPETLGGLLLLLGASAFVGMQVCGPLIDRFGSRRLTACAAAVLCLVISGPVLAGNLPTLACAMAAFGFANGSLDVSMNAQAVAVERAYRRPIMSSFHGWFTLGSMAGSAIVALTLWRRIPAPITVAVAAALGLLVVALAAPRLLDAAAQSDDVEPVRQRWWRLLDRRVVVLAVVAFALMLAEGTAYDWSALQVVETFGVPDAAGAIAFFAFSTAMAVSRFGVDRFVHRFGPVACVRTGVVVGAVGMSMVVAAGEPWIALAGWFVFGLGLAGGIPQIFTAAGNLSAAASGRLISLVVGCGYLGMLAGPAVVGVAARTTSLQHALIVVVGALAIAFAGASCVRREQVGRVGDGSRGGVACRT